MTKLLSKANKKLANKYLENYGHQGSIFRSSHGKDNFINFDRLHYFLHKLLGE